MKPILASTLSEIAQNPLRAELVTLAACATARRQAMLSNERIDLTLGEFYQTLRQGGPAGTPLPKNEALTEARRRSRQRGADTELWAAWVLIGDAR
jgi:CHAT domain-containing protein